jgi:hypothetical protein
VSVVSDGVRDTGSKVSLEGSDIQNGVDMVGEELWARKESIP